MTNPLDLLPLIKDDTYKFIFEDSERTLDPGTGDVIEIDIGRGYYYGAVSTIIGENGEDTELSIVVDDFRADATPREMYESGFTNPLGITPGLGRYNEDNNIFTAVHNPLRPIGFNDIVKFRHDASDESEGINVDTTIYGVGIAKPKEFVREYLELTSPGAKEQVDMDAILERFNA